LVINIQSVHDAQSEKHQDVNFSTLHNTNTTRLLSS